ncbi:hypothetical protein FGO68_gene5774 [Halteria grandinella]|uniref:Uncharacterized protein n=1 Tax=Halteria grandinella TaxID=5974 RepID=A0A8J8ND33_HALGN|nr:hypothetical protein FGO68_gene5774 [Halteria grandinella]
MMTSTQSCLPTTASCLTALQPPQSSLLRMSTVCKIAQTSSKNKEGASPSTASSSTSSAHSPCRQIAAVISTQCHLNKRTCWVMRSTWRPRYASLTRTWWGLRCTSMSMGSAMGRKCCSRISGISCKARKL